MRVAGRNLPLYIVVATTFATWFGSELVLGVSGQFMQEGLGGVVEDPFGAGMCLILVGLFFAYKLYKKNLHRPLATTTACAYGTRG